jgi:hypothetical protein
MVKKICKEGVESTTTAKMAEEYEIAEKDRFEH